jgi:hypothetical protein
VGGLFLFDSFLLNHKNYHLGAKCKTRIFFLFISIGVSYRSKLTFGTNDQAVIIYGLTGGAAVTMSSLVIALNVKAAHTSTVKAS